MGVDVVLELILASRSGKCGVRNRCVCFIFRVIFDAVSSHCVLSAKYALLPSCDLSNFLMYDQATLIYNRTSGSQVRSVALQEWLLQ